MISKFAGLNPPPPTINSFCSQHVNTLQPEGSEEGDATEVNDGEVEEMDESETLIEETKLKGGSFSDNQVKLS